MKKIGNGGKCLESALKSAALALVALGVLGVQNSGAATAAIYGGGPFYVMNAANTAALRTSGYTTLSLWTIHIRPNGDFYYNDTLICQNGSYVGDPGWGARLNAVKATPSTIYRIEMSIGAWASGAFQAIKDRIAADGTGSNTILYRNLQALKNAIPIDAISYDDELTYDVASSVAFGNMVSALGMKVTLCPYTNSNYWQSVKSQLGSKVDAIYLQCYAGGASNNPATWNNIFGGFKVIPGCWNQDSVATVQSKMSNWHWNAGITGGFMWLFDDMGAATATNYASAVLNGVGLHSGTYALINRKSGLALDPQGGATGSGTPLIQWGYSGSNNMRWNMSFLTGGQARITGVASGRVAQVAGASVNNDASLQLGDYTGANHQKVTFTSNGAGYYTPIYVHSGKAMTVHGASTAPGAGIIQYTYNAGQNAQWQFRTP
jgi:hypothetical protein